MKKKTAPKKQLCRPDPGCALFPPRKLVLGTTPQGTKTEKAFAGAEQKVVGSMRSNSRENVTVVTAISADGTTWKPTIIFKGQRVQADWISEENGPPDARYTATDSSFMQGAVFLKYLKDFHKQLGERGLLDG